MVKAISKATLLFVQVALTSCGASVRGRKYYVLDFDTFDEMCADLEFQNSISKSESFNLFDYHMPSAVVDYHISGIDYTDDYIMEGYDIPSDKKIFKNRCVFLVNRLESENIVISFSNSFDKNTNINNLRWVMTLDYTQNYNDPVYPFEEKAIDAAQTKFEGKVDNILQIFALVNEKNQRLIWVGSSLGKDGFELVKDDIEEKVLESLYD